MDKEHEFSYDVNPKINIGFWYDGKDCNAILAESNKMTIKVRNSSSHSISWPPYVSSKISKTAYMNIIRIILKEVSPNMNYEPIKNIGKLLKILKAEIRYCTDE